MADMNPLALAWVWPDSLIAVGIIVVIAVLTRWLIVRAISLASRSAIKRARAQRDRTLSRAERLLSQATGLDSERAEQRIRTVASLSRNLVSITVVVIGLLTIMSVFDIPTAPLLASAGVGGLVLAFGAQSLIKDFISGIFMIMEDQYGVGDLVDVGEVRGTVEEVGLRVTQVRDLTGTLWYVRNGEILRVGNQSQGWSTAIIDVPVAQDEDSERVIEILDQVAADAEDDEELSKVLLERPAVAGVNSVSATTMIIRMTAKATANQHFGVQRTLLARSMAALAKAGVRGPVTTFGVVGQQ
ncbi:small conductance mechanosensitive channel [Propionicimonas paludicola]|uniref:Small conductance mechanosensitive channel n=2 Tax=Propionicimonas paludicola TaxID=185243 RepID=A0A2A9CV07_9ACTN|nr:small conductance mechanosensitive channel [Propionicimonas paludicola]